MVTDAEAKALIDLAKNLQPDLVPELEEVFTPKGDSQVAKSPNFIYLICAALKGLPARIIQRMLKEERKEDIPWVMIRDYILAYVPPHLSKSGIYIQHVANQYKGLDEAQIMENIMRIQYARVSLSLEADRNPEEIRREMDLLVKATKSTAEVRAILGKVKSPIPPLGEHPIENPVQQVDARSAAKVLKVLEDLVRLTKTDKDPKSPEPPDETKVVH